MYTYNLSNCVQQKINTRYGANYTIGAFKAIVLRWVSLDYKVIMKYTNIFKIIDAFFIY